MGTRHNLAERLALVDDTSGGEAHISIVHHRKSPSSKRKITPSIPPDYHRDEELLHQTLFHR